MLTNEEFDALPVQYFSATCYTLGCDDAYLAKTIQCQLPPEMSAPLVTCGVCGQTITTIVKLS